MTSATSYGVPTLPSGIVGRIACSSSGVIHPVCTGPRETAFTVTPNLPSSMAALRV